MATTGISFNPSTDIPSLEGKVILITGTNSGLGKQASLELAKHKPALIWMAARSPEKGNEAVADVKGQVPGVAATFLQLDLSSFDSIRKAAKTVLEGSTRLDILMLNAGLMGCPPKLTTEGYEIQMGTNHVGHALLLKLLTPLILKTASSHPVRVVSLASSAWKYAGPEKIQFETLKSLEGVTPVNRYIQSKVANMLYPQEFAKHHPQLTIVSIDPGDVATQLFSREPGDEQMKYLQTEVAPKRVRSVEEGVVSQLWAATGEGVTSGLHYAPVGLYESMGLALDTELAEKVWEWTRKELEGQDI
ncbi:putative oxidoreductase [Lachnellula occidentalis]|uniref:Putative oxidoreductase n=1 Tax=Lachnellula occidentalis TaxID=215460 RepID=A0A8H8UAY2_9HELO|nr:putative oxidoreductase [Lachnellula occidentalis]